MEYRQAPVKRVFDKVRALLRERLQGLSDKYFTRYLRRRVLELVYQQPYVFGANPLSISSSACVNNALFNTMSGSITIEDNVSFGHNVSVLTGTHDLALRDKERQDGWPDSGRDIIIQRGAWIASNATILGPCVVGEHAVVAAGAVVVQDVPPRALVGGVPARVIKEI